MQAWQKLQSRRTAGSGRATTAGLDPGWPTNYGINGCCLLNSKGWWWVKNSWGTRVKIAGIWGVFFGFFFFSECANCSLKITYGWNEFTTKGILLSSAQPGGTAADRHNEGFAYISSIYTYILPHLSGHTFSATESPWQTGGHQQTLGGHLHLWCLSVWKMNHRLVSRKVFFFFCERLLNLFFWAFERDTIQQDAMGSANKVFPPPPSLLYSIAPLAFTYQEELSSPTRLPCQQESVSLRQVVLAGSTFESKKSGCLERQSCQPHFPQTAVTQAVTSQGCVLTNTFRRGPEQMGIVAVVTQTLWITE